MHLKLSMLKLSMFLYSPFLAADSLKIPIPFVPREVPQPTAAQLTPSILFYKTSCAEAILCCFICALLYDLIENLETLTISEDLRKNLKILTIIVDFTENI